MLSFKGFLLLAIGGFLIGFGTRYANGCTSGHAITGLSHLQITSLVAVIGFFIGGLIKSGIEVDRKMLSDLAIHQPDVFAQLVKQSQM